MRTAGRMLAALVLAAAATGCGDERSPAPAPEGAPVSGLAGPCPVTAPGGDVPGPKQGFNYGNGAIGVHLWPNGTLVAGRLPGGGIYATIEPDGSIVAKLGWWRAVEGPLRIEGERLDACAPKLRAQVPAGYGPSGFQPSSLTFPTTGCWAVAGSVGRVRLRFVVRVRTVRER